MDPLQRIQAFAKLLLMQLELYGQLANVEWQEEKRHLQQLATIIMLGVVFFAAFLFGAGIFLVTLVWDTDYRLFAIAALVGTYGLGAAVCSYWVRKKMAGSYKSFSAIRAEIISDIELIRSQL